MSTPNTPAPLDAGDGLEKPRLGGLDLREDVLQGFASIRERHARLQATLHQVMRRVVLPQAREIGQELARIKALYESGRKGPGGRASRFYTDCESLTGLRKAQIANYVQLAANWHRLMDYMADLPDGAQPITSMRGAMEAIRSMNRPERPALAGAAGSVDVEAEDLGPAPAEGASSRTRYTERPRELASSLQALRAVQAIPEPLRDRLQTYCTALELLLDSIESALAESEPEPVATPPARGPVAAPAPEPEWSEPEPEPEPEAGRQSLAALYPATPEGLEDLETAVAAAGSGAGLARQLGCTRAAVSQRLKRIRQVLAETPQAS